MANSVPEITQISTLLSNIAENYDELARNWFNVFYNPTPMDVEVKFFNKEGILFTAKLPNRAKDFRLILNGEGTPEGNVSAGKGAIYQDTLNGRIYLKNSVSGTTGVSTDGWIELITINSMYTFGIDNPIGKVNGKRGCLYAEIGTTSSGQSKVNLYVNTSNSDEGSYIEWVKVSGEGSSIEEFKYVHTTGDEDVDGKKTFLEDVIVKRGNQAFTVYNSTNNGANLQVGISSNAEKGIYDVDNEQWLLKIDKTKNNVHTTCPHPNTSDNSNNLATTYWVRNATGNTALNAASADKATKDSEGNNISQTYQKKLTAGTGITINDNVISSTGGGIHMSYDKESATLKFTE